MWDCTALIDDAAKQFIITLGGIDVIAMSHPHFYRAHVDIADHVDAGVVIPRANQPWVQRPSPRIVFFDEYIEPVPGLTVARIGGHFDGAAVPDRPAGRPDRTVEAILRSDSCGNTRT